MNDDDQLWIAVVIDGLEYRVKELQRLVESLLVQVGHKPRGRPRKSILVDPVAKKAASGWPADPEERKAEAKRRMKARHKTKRPHWTQTPEGREKMRQIAKARHKSAGK